MILDWPSVGPTTPNQLIAWFDQGYDIGWIMGPRLAALDFDSIESFSSFYHNFKNMKFCAQRTVRGIHVIFHNPNGEIGNAVNVNGTYDVRGSRGYVKIHGDFIEGHGETDPDKLDSFRPEWLPQPKNTPTQKIKLGGDMVYRAMSYINKVPPAALGERDNSAFVVAIKLMNFGLSVDEAYPILLSWGMRCDPPFTQETILRRKLDEALKG